MGKILRYLMYLKGRNFSFRGSSIF